MSFEDWCDERKCGEPTFPIPILEPCIDNGAYIIHPDLIIQRRKFSGPLSCTTGSDSLLLSNSNVNYALWFPSYLHDMVDIEQQEPLLFTKEISVSIKAE